VFDFAISKNWHQLVLYNNSETPRHFNIPISGNTAFGSLGLAADQDYYLYDFWNNRFAGRFNGSGDIEQSVEPGEARMLSIHAVESGPQWISTDRHLMQGYVDLVKKPQWDASDKTLCATSEIIGNEPYVLVIALNGYIPLEVEAEGAKAIIPVHPDNTNLADLIIKRDTSGQVPWRINFTRPNHPKH